MEYDYDFPQFTSKQELKRTMLPEAIENTYRTLQTARLDLYHASEELIKFRQEIEARKAEGYKRRKIRGNNVEERKASEFSYVEDMIEDLCELEENERAAKYHHEQASTGVELIKQLLRLEELHK
jgi:alpha-galactosidase/6-phospho-beta-glucosidase family protein